MNPKLAFLGMVTIASILSGCASPATNKASLWIHPEGRTIDQTEQDLAACRLAGRTQGGALQKNVAWYLATREGSVSDDAVRDCMIAKGYKPAPSPK